MAEDYSSDVAAPDRITITPTADGLSATVSGHVTVSNSGVVKFEVSSYPTNGTILMNSCDVTVQFENWAFVPSADISEAPSGTIKVGS